MATMDDIFQEKRTEILEKVKVLVNHIRIGRYTIVDGLKECTINYTVLVPESWAEDRAADLMNAVLGKGRIGNSWETTKAGKLLDAEASLRGMKYQQDAKMIRVWWQPQTYNDLLELLADLAGEIRTGKVKMHWPKYESLVEEAIKTYFEFYDFNPPKSGHVPIRLFGQIGIDTVYDLYWKRHSSKYDGGRKLRDEIKDGKWEGIKRPDGSKKWNIFE